MKHLRLTHIILSGLVVWAVPFLVSMPFFDRGGNLLIDIFAFKTLMILVSSLIGLWLLARFLGKSQTKQHHTGLAIGLIWLGINWVLDFLILLPLQGIGPQEYFLATGLRYLHMPFAGFFMGLALHSHAKEVEVSGRTAR